MCAVWPHIYTLFRYTFVCCTGVIIVPLSYFFFLISFDIDIVFFGERSTLISFLILCLVIPSQISNIV